VCAGVRGFAVSMGVQAEGEGEGKGEEERVVSVEDTVVEGESTERRFEAETSKLLSIVANSLYTDKEVLPYALIVSVKTGPSCQSTVLRPC
jgi:hypothetical protein